MECQRQQSLGRGIGPWEQGQVCPSVLPALETHAQQRGQTPGPAPEVSCAVHTVHRQPVAAPVKQILSDCVQMEGCGLGALL